MDRRLRQAELARRCDISASYLNLIEHNRRKIGGALLNRLAKALEVDPATLSEGAETALTSALGGAAARQMGAQAEIDRAEEFAGRFPGWARLIEVQYREALRMERVVEGLNDRLTHDPFLSASLHDVLTSVTAIRSASAILAEGEDIAPEWQARFHRNILEDSRRLAHSTERLVSYLDAGADVDRGMSLPQEDVETWLETEGWSVPSLEADPSTDPGPLLENAASLGTVAARHLARRYLERYADDVQSVPAGNIAAAMKSGVVNPAALAEKFGVGLPVIFRRLATMPSDGLPGGVSRGLLACDGSGTLTFRKPLQGFDFPRYGAACPLWPLFQALQRPMQPIRQVLRVAGRDEKFFTAWAFAEIRYPGGFDTPGVVEAWMLIEPQLGATDGERSVGVGTSCRICSQPDCPARREPSLLATSTLAGGMKSLLSVGFDASF